MTSNYVDPTDLVMGTAFALADATNHIVTPAKRAKQQPELPRHTHWLLPRPQFDSEVGLYSRRGGERALFKGGGL